VKLSGLYKISDQPFPNEDGFAFVDALVEALTPDCCAWGPNWPFPRAKGRVDYGVLREQARRLFPDSDIRRRIFWETPRRLLKFAVD
jgi:predicted TIM-barrel fold metal-dependent hydrolase